MATIANVVLRDDTTTPLDYTFVPLPQQGNSFAWRTADVAIPLTAQKRLTGSWAKLKDGGFKVTAKLEIPVMEQASGGNQAGYVAAPAVAYTLVGIITMFLPGRCTTNERKNTLRMMTHFLQGATNSPAQGQNAASASGDLFNQSTAAAHQAFVSLAAPNS